MNLDLVIDEICALAGISREELTSWELGEIRKRHELGDSILAIKDRLFSCGEEPYDGFLTDAEADADVLSSAGWGTDEDYGYFGGEDW